MEGVSLKEENIKEEGDQAERETLKEVTEKQAGSEEYETVKEYLPFVDGIFSLPCCRLFVLFLDVVKMAFYASGTYLGPSLQFTISVVCLNHMKLGFEQACLGIISSMHFICGLSLGWPVQEKLGIVLSEQFGQKHYDAMKLSLQKGLISLAVFIFLITTPLYFFSGPLLEAAGIDSKISWEAQGLLRLYIIVHMISMGGDSIKTYCLAQGLEDYFSWMTLINFTLSGVGLWFFIVELDTKVWGYLYIRLITDSITLFTSLWVYFYKVLPESRGFGPWSQAFKEFPAYFKDCFIFVVGSFVESIGYEVCSYFVALLHDNEQMAAFVNALSLSSTVYNIGLSFSIVSRTRINILLGMGLHRIAKRAYLFFMYCAILVGILVWAVMFPLREQVADLFSDSTPRIRKYYMVNLLVYLCYIPFELSIYTVYVGVKSIGKIGYQVTYNIFWLLAVNICVNLIFKHLGFESNAIWILGYTCQAGIYICSLLTALFSDWSLWDKPNQPENGFQELK